MRQLCRFWLLENSVSRYSLHHLPEDLWASAAAEDQSASADQSALADQSASADRSA